MNKIDLNNRTAVVTGGVQGFGLAVVKRFIVSGAKVVIWDRDQKLLDDLNIDNTIKINIDISNFDNVSSGFKSTLERVDKVDILVNNAGIAGPTVKSWEYPNDDWQKIMDINLTGTFNCCKVIVPHMIKNNYGRIVNVASIAGKEGNPNAMPYSASKAGVIALTKSLGKELADKNIAVNCITPAATQKREYLIKLARNI